MKENTTMDTRTELKALFGARNPMVNLVTSEEGRALDLLKELAKEAGTTLSVWSATKGFECPVRGAKATQVPASKDKGLDPHMALVRLEKADMPGIFVLKDFAPFVKDPLVLRALRDVVESFRGGRHPRTLLLLSVASELPPELEKVAAVVDLDLPTRQEIRALAEPLARMVGQELTESIVDACMGLSYAEAENALAKSAVTLGKLDPHAINAEKRQTVRKSGVLEFIETEEDLGTLGGLDSLKDWASKRRKGFSQAARDFGLPRPKGMLLVGPPGTGKSLAPKGISSDWAFPLIRADIGALMGGLVGQSEGNMRRLIQTAEACAPCILWIDEIEKGFSGTGSSGMTDGGTTSRLFSTFLTWMQEKTSDVFIVATANDVTSLPPELLRKGRFDETFFVDLPTREERAQIFDIHLGKVGRGGMANLEELAELTDGFTGAEIEAVVGSALFDAFDADEELAQSHLEGVIPSIVPLSQTREEDIEALRDWAKGRARPAASTPSEDKGRAPLVFAQRVGGMN